MANQPTNLPENQDEINLKRACQRNQEQLSPLPMPLG